MTIEDIEKEVLEWHRETFPNATDEAIDDKLQEEVAELNGEIYFGDDKGKKANEIADVCIVSIAMLARMHTSLSAIIAAKLAVNKARTWGPEQPDGNRIKESK